MPKDGLRVTGYGLRAASCELKVSVFSVQVSGALTGSNTRHLKPEYTVTRNSQLEQGDNR